MSYSKQKSKGWSPAQKKKQTPSLNVNLPDDLKPKGFRAKLKQIKDYFRELPFVLSAANTPQTSPKPSPYGLRSRKTQKVSIPSPSPGPMTRGRFYSTPAGK